MSIIRIKIKRSKKKSPLSEVWIPARRMKKKYKYLSRYGTKIRKRQLFDDSIQIKWYGQYGCDGVMTLPLDYRVIRYSDRMAVKLRKEYENREPLPAPSRNGKKIVKLKVVKNGKVKIKRRRKKR